MDPNALRTRLWVLSQSVVEAVGRGDGSISPDTAHGLAQGFLDLDEWLSRGGFPPAAWDHGAPAGDPGLDG